MASRAKYEPLTMQAPVRLAGASVDNHAQGPLHSREKALGSPGPLHVLPRSCLLLLRGLLCLVGCECAPCEVFAHSSSSSSNFSLTTREPPQASSALKKSSCD